MPECPKELSRAARQIWQQLIAVVPAGVVTQDNGQTLARYCHMLARWWKLAGWIDTNPETCTAFDRQGNKRITRHPNLITYEKLSKDLLRAEQEFGLTPSARSRIQAVAAPRSSAPQRAQGPAEKFVLRIAE